MRHGKPTTCDQGNHNKAGKAVEKVIKITNGRDVNSAIEAAGVRGQPSHVRGMYHGARIAPEQRLRQGGSSLILVKDHKPQKRDCLKMHMRPSVDDEETEMNIFHLHAEKEQEGTRHAGTWFVVADSPHDAIALVPQGFSVKDVDIQVPAVAGPGRVIGCFAAPPMR